MACSPLGSLGPTATHPSKWEGQAQAVAAWGGVWSAVSAQGREVQACLLVRARPGVMGRAFPVVDTLGMAWQRLVWSLGASLCWGEGL